MIQNKRLKVLIWRQRNNIYARNRGERKRKIKRDSKKER